jgi:uncharacterized membrane protein
MTTAGRWAWLIGGIVLLIVAVSEVSQDAAASAAIAAFGSGIMMMNAAWDKPR